MSETIIKASRVGKLYNLEQGGKYYNLRDLIADSPKNVLNKYLKKKKSKKGNFWALKNVSFEVKKGEVLGVIGRNGAGKSTLLKILARIVPPTTGKISIKGRVASILEVGTGFHTELTGRENVFLSGAILGMRKEEIKRKFDEIVKFSDIGKFIDMPVKRYSSGMHVRLAFSIVVHLDPEVLIIDEVLFVSHSMTAVDSLCDRVILLEEGRLVAEGKTRKVISEYMSDYVPEDEMPQIGKVKSRSGSGKVRLIDFWMEDENKKRISTAMTGGQCRFVFKFLCPNGKPQKDVDFGFGIANDVGQPLFLHYSTYTEQELGKCPVKGKFVFSFDKLPLAKGVYKMGMRVTVKGEEADVLPGAVNIKVDNGDFYKTGLIMDQSHSPMYVDGSWKFEK